MARMTTPLQADEGWPYPDGAPEPIADEEVDLDVLELQVDPHLWDLLTDLERGIVLERFGLDKGRARSMKELAHARGMTHAEIRDILERALGKIKERLNALDEA